MFVVTLYEFLLLMIVRAIPGDIRALCGASPIAENRIFDSGSGDVAVTSVWENDMHKNKDLKRVA